MSDERLSNIFEEYDNADPVSSSVENDDLKRLSLKTAREKQEERQLKTKKNGLLNIASKVEEAINKQFEGKFASTEKIKLTLTFSAAASDSIIGKRPAMFKNAQGEQTSQLPVLLNVNLKKISKLPALEVYSLLYTEMHKFAEKELVKQNYKESTKEEILEDAESDKKETPEEKKQAQEKLKAIDYLSDYLMDFLPKAFGSKFTGYTHISVFIAKQLVEKMEESGLNPAEVLGLFFDPTKLNDKAVKLVNDFLGTPGTVARFNNIRRKATELALDPNRQLQALSYEEQFEALMSVTLTDKFKESVSGYDPNNKDIPLNKFKDFCVSYANTFMQTNGLKGIEVTFDRVGELGTFFDNGRSPRINVNLDKISTISELAMTLSHELTHAVDASINKVQGNYNRSGGGLMNSISEDISGSGLNKGSKAYNFLNELQNYAYHINPNEIHARIGELSALKFMQEMSKDNPIFAEQIEKSSNGFVNYQAKTFDLIGKIKNSKFTENLTKQMNELEPLPIAARKMMEERISYLEQMANSELVSETALAGAIAENLSDRGLIKQNVDGTFEVASGVNLSPELKTQISQMMNEQNKKGKSSGKPGSGPSTSGSGERELD